MDAAGGAEIRGCECVLLVLILEGAAPFGFKGAGFVSSSKFLLPRSFLALSPSEFCSPPSPRSVGGWLTIKAPRKGAALFVIFKGFTCRGRFIRPGGCVFACRYYQGPEDIRMDVQPFKESLIARVNFSCS